MIESECPMCGSKAIEHGKPTKFKEKPIFKCDDCGWEGDDPVMEKEPIKKEK